jgi:GDPmannose 4,6-dehydratase
LQIAFGLINKNWNNYVVIDPEFYRPAEVDYLRGNSDKAKKLLGWEPKIPFEDLVKDMVNQDIEITKND